MDRHDPNIGTTVDGRYEILAALGEGGMGTVYKGRHLLLSKTVAVKVLGNASADPQATERFRREAKSASMINHENVVAITDFGVLPDSRPYLVMEFLQGPTLADLLDQGPPGVLRSLQIAQQIARGLAAVHDMGVIHRDLKPENIFVLGRQGQDLVKIVDFGLAQVQSSARLTKIGMVMGTAFYISPEQASGAPLDARCDQYGLGCLLYEMLTGTRPFTDESPAIVMKQHVFDFAPALRQRRPDLEISDGLEALQARLLLKQPGQRFASMHEVAAALQQEIDRLVQAPTDLLRGPGRRRARQGVGVAVAALCGVGIAVGVAHYREGARIRRRLDAMAGESRVTVTSGPVRQIAEGPASDSAPGEAGHKAPPPTTEALEVHFSVARPARDVTIACTPDLKQVCRKSCTVNLAVTAADATGPDAGQCVASAPGYGSQAVSYGELRSRAGKRGKTVKQKLTLVPIR